MIVIGIDPDIKKSGVAIYNKENYSLEVYSFDVIDLFSFLLTNSDKINLVVIERGENNKAYFTDKYNPKNFKVALKIATNIGKNFAITDIIAHACEKMGLNFEFYTPKTEKLTKKTICNLLDIPLNTKINQEEIDAIRCILSIIIKNEQHARRFN